MLRITPQELYALELRLRHTPLRWRPRAFRNEGGTLLPPGDDAWDWDNTQWWAELAGIRASGCSRTHAIASWLRFARRSQRDPANVRATDHRPDCPYNGQGLAP